MKSIRPAHPATVLITEVPISVDEEFANRRRRYLIMMSGRAVCVVAAVLVYKLSPWLAAALLLGAAVLPWAAVLSANNRPAKQALRFRRFVPGSKPLHRELTAAPTAESPPEAPGAGANRSSTIDL